MEKQNGRQSNFELLRVICMISIVSIHLYKQTDAVRLELEDGAPYFFILFLGYGGRLVCNCFVMIGAWFLCDARFKADRIVKLWLYVFSYTTIITITCTLLNIQGGGIILLVQSFLPVMGRPVWFAAEYLCMLMLSPFLNMLLEHSRIVCYKLLIIFGGLIITCATLFPIEHTTPAFSELVWFCFLYMFVAYFKKYPCLWMENKSICVIGAILGYLICVLCYVVLREFGFDSLAEYYNTHYENALSFITSVFLFYAFKNINIGNVRMINVVSESTFAVYVIHQTPCFYPTLWNGIFSVDEYVGKQSFIIYVLYVIFLIFIVSVVVEHIRKSFFERFIYKSRLYKGVCVYIGRFYDFIGEK